MEGCSAPLVVKFADTQKEKDQKKIQQIQASICGTIPLAATAPTAASLTGLQVPAAVARSSQNTALTNLSRTNHSLSSALAVAPLSQSNSGTALLPTSSALSVTPSNLSLASNPQQSSTYSLSAADGLNSMAAAQQLHIFHQISNFGSHSAQYLQGE